MRLAIRLCVVVMLLVCGYVNAQTVTKASMASSRPLISRDEIGFSLCGIHTVASVELMPLVIEIYDFSIQYAASQLVGTMKIGKKRADGRDLDAAAKNLDATIKAVRPGPASVWIARETEGKPMQLKVLFESKDSPGYVLGHVDGAKGFDTMTAIATGERMHLVARYKSEKLDHIIAYEAPLSDEDQKLFFACTAGLIERLKRTANGSQER